MALTDAQKFCFIGSFIVISSAYYVLFFFGIGFLTLSKLGALIFYLVLGKFLYLKDNCFFKKSPCFCRKKSYYWQKMIFWWQYPLSSYSQVRSSCVDGSQISAYSWLCIDLLLKVQLSKRISLAFHFTCTVLLWIQLGYLTVFCLSWRSEKSLFHKGHWCKFVNWFKLHMKEFLGY